MGRPPHGRHDPAARFLHPPGGGRDGSARSVVSVAVAHSGEALYVPPCLTRPSASGSISARRPANAAIGTPPPSALANTARSGTTWYRPCAPPGPVRNPVHTSSKISGTPYAVHSSRSSSRQPGAGIVQALLATMGSQMTAASRPRWAASTVRSASGSFHGQTTTSSTTPGGMPGECGTERGAAAGPACSGVGRLETARVSDQPW